MFTLQEFNEALDIPYRLDQERVKTVYIDKKHQGKLHFIKENTILVHLLTQTALTVPKRFEGLLIPSNFVVIQFTEQYDGMYFEWYFNEHPNIRRQIAMHTQGAIVSTLSTTMLKEMIMDTVTYGRQVDIGRMYRLQKRKNRLLEEKRMLETKRMNQYLLNITEAKQ